MNTTAILLHRLALLRAAVERGADDAMAGNGVDGLRQALWQDDQLAEQQRQDEQAELTERTPTPITPTPADAELARHVTTIGGINA